MRSLLSGAIGLIVLTGSAIANDARTGTSAEDEVRIGTLEVPAAAAKRLKVAISNYDAGDLRAAQYQLEQIVADYSETRYARHARRYLAKIYQGLDATGDQLRRDAPLSNEPGTGEWKTKVSAQDNFRAVANPSTVHPDKDKLRKHLDETASEQLRFAAGDRVFFGSDSSDLGSRARSVLRRQAGWLTAHDTFHILLEGHADDSGGKAVNKTLSTKRANVVRTRLIAEGVSPDRIFIDGLGQANPIAPCSSKECAAQNRRVVTVVINLPHGKVPRLGDAGTSSRDAPRAGLGQAMWLGGPK